MGSLPGELGRSWREESRALEEPADGCCICWDTWMICSTRSSGMFPSSCQALEQFLRQPRNATTPGAPQGRCFLLELWFVMLVWCSSLEAGTVGSSWQGQGLGKGSNPPALRVRRDPWCLREAEHSRKEPQGKSRSTRVRTSWGNLSLHSRTDVRGDNEAGGASAKGNTASPTRRTWNSSG